MIRPDPHFPASYVQGRERFLAAARACGAQLEHHVHPHERGIDGEELAIDLALFGPAGAKDVLMLQSGTHGVEGYCGSGIQHALLHEANLIRRTAALGVRVILLHALNPWGFSWRRRVNEDNVDLNRNFRVFAAAPDAPPPDPDYDEVHPLLLPAQWPWTAQNQAAIVAFVAARGPAHWQFAVTHGQQSHPDGLFYAGDRPTWSNQTLRAVLQRHVRGAQRLYSIDVHTGLGPSGVGEMIYGGADNAQDVARTRACWGERVTSVYEGSSTSSKVEGQAGLAAIEECPGTAFAGIGLEFGTWPVDRMLEALRFDQWVRIHAPNDAALVQRAREQMLAMFFVDTDDWKDAILMQGRDAFVKAARTLEAR